MPHAFGPAGMLPGGRASRCMHMSRVRTHSKHTFSKCFFFEWEQRPPKQNAVSNLCTSLKGGRASRCMHMSRGRTHSEDIFQMFFLSNGNRDPQSKTWYVIC